MTKDQELSERVVEAALLLCTTKEEPDFTVKLANLLLAAGALWQHRA